MYENGEEVKIRTVAFSKSGSHNKIRVTIKDHFTWEKILERAWNELSSHLQIPVKELQSEFTLDNKTDF